MTEADLTGADAHGVFRLPQYVNRVKAGGLNRRPNITVERTAAATALVDGDNGFGHLVMSRAAETAIAMAREAGISWAGVRRSNHAGPAGLYAEMPVPHGMVGLYSAVASANHMAVWGGAETLLGTNPLAIGLPARDGPMVFDMAATVVSYGTVKNRRPPGPPRGGGVFRQPPRRHAAHRPAPQCRRAAAADRRLQGQRARAHARPSRRHAQRRRLRARRRRLQRRRGERDQHRAFHRCARRGALRAARDVHGRGRSPSG